MKVTEFEVGTTYLSTVKRDVYLAGMVYPKGYAFKFTVVGKPCNEFNGTWLRVSVEGYKYPCTRVYLDDLENIKKEKQA